MESGRNIKGDSFKVAFLVLQADFELDLEKIHEKAAAHNSEKKRKRVKTDR